MLHYPLQIHFSTARPLNIGGIYNLNSQVRFQRAEILVRRLTPLRHRQHLDDYKLVDILETGFIPKHNQSSPSVYALVMELCDEFLLLSF